MDNNDLIHRSAALAVLEELKNHVASPDPVGEVADAIETMRKVQAVDAVEVVRCKDCAFFKYGDYCTEDKLEHSKCRPDDFCSYGKREMDAEVTDDQT